MKKFFLLTLLSMVTVSMMAIGNNSGSTKANAIDFDWSTGVEHQGGTKWYRVDLAPLYEEENPSLTLYLTNPSNEVGTSVDVSMKATVAGESESKDYTIAARQYKTYTANASMLVRMRQTEIYLTLTSTGRIKLSAKVFEAADLDETCKDARVLAWDAEAVQNPSYSAWWKVSLLPIKNVEGFDAQVTITNTGSKTVNLKVGQSLDCPSSGTTRREYTLAAGEAIVKKIPRDMITSVQPDELYFGIENVESEVSIKVEKVAQPPVAIIPDYTVMPGVNLLVTDTIEPMPTVTTLYKISVADMDSLAKYEPEFTYRNAGTTPAHVSIKMAFRRPAFGTSDTEYDIPVGEEEIVVYKKNMFEGMTGVDSIYLLTTVTGDVNFYGRFKHVREGKACKTNIDYNWETGHTQEARTTQWYAIDLDSAKHNTKDVIVYIQNKGTASATVKASMAFSCPYIDLQEITRSVAAGQTIQRRMAYSTYAMMSDIVYIGLETNQDIKFWADLVDAEKKAEVDTICMDAVDFDWEQGVLQQADTSIWYRVDMTQVRSMAAKFPTVFVQNLSSSASAVITAELSLECPDSIANQKRSLTIAANESYSRQLSRNMFENIKSDTIYLKVHSTQQISLQIRLTEEAEGASCSSAIPFNWVSGNSQKANENLWYSVDLRNIMHSGNDLKLHLQNRDNTTCKGVLQLSYECPVVSAPSIQNFTLGGNATKSVTIQNSALETLEDSIIYINVQGTTGLRFWADTLAVESFDTIYANQVTLQVLQWDSLYTQTTDTAWYIIPKSEIDKVRNLDEKVKPVAHLFNLGAATTIKAEAAFAFPIVKKMMTKSQKLKAGQHYSDTVPVGTFEQFLKKDSIIIRVTRPAGAANFQFRAELVKAFGGNSRNDALPIRMGQQYTQSPNTDMWYKINTADWKKDPDLYNKKLFISTKNAGNGDAKVQISVYEGLLSDVDMLEEYGLGDYRERTIKKGQGKSHDIPAQAVYALGDVELYVKVRTTDSLVFNSKFDGVYAPQAVDPNQAKAILVVPNVDYVVPGDNQEHWYQVCFPYIRNNYTYAHETCYLSYELNGTATIEATATLQDSMNCAMPVRKRTINKNGGFHQGTKPLYELIDKGIKRFSGRAFEVEGFQSAFVDSLLRRYITSDSITGYVRIKTDKDLKVRLIMPQTTGNSCVNFMEFDWEHGNVNPADATTWYRVELDESRVPEGKDLMLHLDNWGDTATTIKAEIYPGDCSAALEGSLTRTVLTDTTKVLERQLLATWGWTNLMIKYNSDLVTHIWAEIVDHVDRDTVEVDKDTTYVCPMTDYEDEYDHVLHTIDPSDPTSWTWTTPYDSIDKADAKITTYMYTYHVLPLQEPDAALYPISSMKSQIVIKRGSAIDVTAATSALFAKLTADNKDSIMVVEHADSIFWEYSTDGSTFLPIPATPLATEAVVLRYRILTECAGDTVTSAPYHNTVHGDTLVEHNACKSYKWEGVTYYANVFDSALYPLPNGCDSFIYLDLQFLAPVTAKDSVEKCHSYTWTSGDGKTYDHDTIVTYTFVGGATNGCDSIVDMKITILPPVNGKDSVIGQCYSYTWTAGDGVTYYNDTIVYFTYLNGAANGCDSIVEMKIDLDHPYQQDLSLVSKYGDRLLMINRNEINGIDPSYKLDLDNDTALVKWYKEATPTDEFLGYGYYYTKANGDVLDAGVYYAVLEIPAVAGDNCGLHGETKHYKVAGAAAAPALVPSLARPGEDVVVLNLDPEKETVIRIFTTEGLLHGTYTVSGETSFTIKAANEVGFYLVELTNDSLKSTLRYIVK
ncbi:MAG: hypothetical protein II605_06580 [Paludibacteraceae bacterium]|nr:hypothetical protein [Paludibacteraceae bacterium]